MTKKIDVRKEDGFTMIELLVTAVILVTLAAIAVPIFLGQREKAADESGGVDIANIAYLIEYGFTDESVAGPQGVAPGTITSTTGSIDKSGATAYWDNDARKTCISVTLPSGEIKVYTSTVRKTYTSNRQCVSASDEPQNTG